MRALSIISLVIGSLCPLGATHASDDPNEPPPGFTALWDGASLDGWTGGTTENPEGLRALSDAERAERLRTMQAKIRAHWAVLAGELVSDGHGPHLVTRRDVGDFELWVDWKIQPGGDSGIYLRGLPQVQIWDPAHEPAHTHGSDKGSGALWNNARHTRFPTAVADRPAGDWNRMHIRMVGQYVHVTLNDVVTTNDVPLENYFDRTRPPFMRGPIHLQTHGSETRFRNLFLRDYTPEESTRALVDIGGGDDGFTPLFDGTTLDGWIGATESYEIVNGELRCMPGTGGNLLTADTYDDFVLRFEFRLPPGGNNGLAIRTPGPEVDAAYAGIELQILDNTAPKFASLQPYQYHGSAYGLAPAQRGYLHPTGTWNYQEVRVEGRRITVELNGFTILETDLEESAATPIDGRAHPGAARTSGHIGFCGHNDPVAFRNVRIKRLSATHTP